MKTILKCIFGAHLYGTNTSESDIDYKGIVVPSSRDILLGNIFRTKKLGTRNDNIKNTKDDLDYDIYSLHYFIKLACMGETAAIDMLHIPKSMILETSNEWEFIQYNKERFYTKNMEAFVGYARRQAAKYGCKGSRLAVIKEVMYILSNVPKYHKMWEVWELLPINEYAKHIEDSPNGAKQYQICEKILQSTAEISYTFNQLSLFYKKYGERAKLAEKNEGIDWKAISHAIRAASQLIELFTFNTITFPRPDAGYLKLVKNGKLNYRNEVEPVIDDLMDEVERLGAVSTLPEKADISFWDEFLIDICKKQIINL